MNTVARAALLWMLVRAAAAPPARAGDATLLLPSGATADGRATVAAGTVRVGSARSRTDEIVSLKLSEVPMERAIDQGVALVCGDVISGVVEELQTGRLKIVSDVLGTVRIPIADLAAIAMMPRGIAELSDPATREAGAMLTNGDFVAGKLEWINKRLVGVFTGRRIVRIPRTRTRFIRLRPAGGNGPSKTTQYVRLLSGERLSGTLRALDADRLVLVTKLAGTVKLPLRSVREVWSEGGRLVPLSSITPRRVRQTSQFDERFDHRVDRSLIGGFLTVAGTSYERGIACHARCELEYELGGRFAALIAEIGVDDGAGGAGRRADRSGEVVFRVHVNGRQVYESDVVRRGAPARMIHVRIGGARHLKLVADFGPDDISWGDHADWCRAVLVKR
jgi:hypothetical protein